MKKYITLIVLFLLAITWIGNAQDHTQQVTAIQYYFNTDPGVGVTGNGGIIAVTPAANMNQLFPLSLPSLPNGINHLYIRAQDEYGKWSIAERRSFCVIEEIVTANLTALEYYYDNDPGVGNGTVQAITPTASYSGTLAITVPGGLSPGIHNLYIRTKDSGGTWTVAERRPFCIIEDVVTANLTAFEYYYDNDPGAGNANPVDITNAPAFTGIVEVGVPCLSTGTHFLYIRAKNESGNWSIIGSGTLEVTEGIEPAVISPAGPLAFCPTGSLTLSVEPNPGIDFQWQKDGLDITGATSSTLEVTEAGNYQVKSYCGAVFSTSNVVEVTEAPLLTYYADTDGDGYGDPDATTLDCSLPAGYAENSDDCDDNNAAINPGAAEVCGNNQDDNCNGEIDEGCCDIAVDAGPDSTTYFGIMSLQTLTRTAVVTGGTSPFFFVWSLGRPLICNQVNEDGDEEFYGGTCQNNICPANGSPTGNATCEGDATITASLLDTTLICVTVTDAYGCTTTDCFYINASDVRCFAGNSGLHKVLMCHHTNSQNNPWVQICVDTSAVAAHLAQGDYIGECDLNKDIEIEVITCAQDMPENLNLHVYPNPTRNDVMLEFISWTEDKYNVEFTDITGRKLIIEQGNAGIGENTYLLNLPGIEPGLYLVRIVLDGKQDVKKLIVE